MTSDSHVWSHTLFPEFMNTDSTTFLGKKVKVVIDRPLGSAHPRHPDIRYAVNYGHIPNTMSGDGMELDAYVLNEPSPLETFSGRCVAVLRRKRENDDKLIVVRDGTTVTDAQIREQTDFQEQFFESEIFRTPPQNRH